MLLDFKEPDGNINAKKIWTLYILALRISILTDTNDVILVYDNASPCSPNGSRLAYCYMLGSPRMTTIQSWLFPIQLPCVRPIKTITKRVVQFRCWSRICCHRTVPQMVHYLPLKGTNSKQMIQIWILSYQLMVSKTIECHLLSAITH